MACSGYYTGLMMTMAQTAFTNNEFGTGSDNSLFDAVSDTIGDFVDSVPFLSDLSDVAQEIAGSVSSWSSEVMDNFSAMGDGIFNGLGLSLTEESKSILDNVIVTEAIKGVSTELLGTDISVYLSHVAQANSWTEGRNAIITSAIVDTAEYVYEYYTGIDAQITGKLSAVNKALPTFSTELAATGSIINLEDLNNLGNPVTLVNNVQAQAGGLALLEPALLAQGINPARLQTVLGQGADLNVLAGLTIQEALGTAGVVAVPEDRLIADTLSGADTTYAGTTSLANKGLGQAIYDALGSVKGSDLSSLQAVMNSNVSGVTSAQDLLDPSKLFPLSHGSMTSAVPVENTQTQQAQSMITGSAKIYTS